MISYHQASETAFLGNREFSPDPQPKQWENIIEELDEGALKVDDVLVSNILFPYRNAYLFDGQSCIITHEVRAKGRKWQSNLVRVRQVCNHRNKTVYV